MDIPTSINNLQLVVRVADDAGDVITGITFDDADLTLEAMVPGAITPAEIILVEGTLDTFLANSWKEIERGYYQFCPSNDLIIPGGVTIFLLTYASNKTQEGVVNASGANNIYPVA